MIDPFILQIGAGTVSDHIVSDPISLKDLLLGFFFALAVKRGRITAILDRALPSGSSESSDE